MSEINCHREITPCLRIEPATMDCKPDALHTELTVRTNALPIWYDVLMTIKALYNECTSIQFRNRVILVDGLFLVICHIQNKKPNFLDLFIT